MTTMTYEQAKRLAMKYWREPIKLLRAFDGYYECPKSPTGERLGPLVAYTGRYQGENRQFVGDIYANFAKVDQWPCVLDILVANCMGFLKYLPRNTVVCGAPEGGSKLAGAIGRHYRWRTITAEKKVTALAAEHGREQSKLIFSRYDIETGDPVLIVEDVCNNFSSSGALIKDIETAGGEVQAITCFLNRSPEVAMVLSVDPKNYPVLAIARRPFPEYRQDDPAVATDIAAGNISWKPKDKNEWSRLRSAMKLS